MHIADLIEALSRPPAYPHSVDQVQVCQTHISLVFLAGPFVYKLKKPVQLGFLDFSTLDKRRFYCDEEVRLNRRLAPRVYLDVVPVVRTPQGIAVEARGELLEWAVKMQRLPEEATLESLLDRHQVAENEIAELARRIARFHEQAETSAHIASFGHFETVATNARENFTQTQSHVGTTVHPAVFDRIRSWTEDTLARLKPLLEQRVSAGQIRDTHGDLRLDHVYFFPDQPLPDDVVILDCIEFNERFRFADPIADMAFLVMDLRYHGRRDLARTFTEAYLTATNSQAGKELVPFYTVYRAMVRAKVEGMKAAESEVPPQDRNRAVEQAKAHWLLALEILEEPARRPCLLLIGGLPGAGKSTLARSLAELAGFTVLRTDVIRKELAAQQGKTGDALYSPEMTEQTYAECLRRSEDLLFHGQRVIIDASFREEANRRRFLDAARRLGVPAAFLVCLVSPDVARHRLLLRTNDASDADWQIHELVRHNWEPASTPTRLIQHEIPADRLPQDTLDQALRFLQKLDLLPKKPQ
jgi:aminoglycoside phosphotransferase family enzyme/predicted kinase